MNKENSAKLCRTPCLKLDAKGAAQDSLKLRPCSSVANKTKKQIKDKKGKGKKQKVCGKEQNARPNQKPQKSLKTQNACASVAVFFCFSLL